MAIQQHPGKWPMLAASIFQVETLNHNKLHEHLQTTAGPASLAIDRLLKAGQSSSDVSMLSMAMS